MTFFCVALTCSDLAWNRELPKPRAQYMTQPSAMGSFMLDFKMFFVSMAGEKAQKLRALAALTENLGVSLGTHTGPRNHL